MRALFISVLVVTLASAAPQKEHHIAKRSGACHLPPYPAHGTYDVVGSPNAKPGDNVDYVYLNVTCSKGYGVIAKSVVICVNGEWSVKMPQCEKCGRVTPMAVPLISDGRPAIYNELPWHAAVYRKQHAQYIFACGGSLVSNTIVISAAHCFWNSLQNKVQPASDFAVGLGKLFRPWNDERDKDAQYSAVKDIKIPPRYQGRRTHFQEDLAVLILETSIVYKPYIRPVCLSFDIEFDRSQLQSGRLGKISGWGLTSADGDDPEILQMTELTYVSIEQCLSTVPKEFYPYIAGDKICAGYTNGTALCKGDTGGGLVFPEYERGVVRHYLRGIVSVALADDNPCNVNSVIGFTHVLKHESFIKEVQNDCANGWDLTGLRCKKLEQSNVQPTSSRPLLDDKCVLPPYPDHGTYQMHNAPFAAPGQGFPLLQLTVNCKPGYRASGNSILFCQDGFWSGDMPTCVRLCKLDQHPSVQYRCLAPDDSAIIRDCNAYEPIGTIVRPECNTPNYYTSYLLPDMKCVDGGWNYVAICTPECGRVTPESVELMIGGRSAYRGELPWHAGIYSQKQGTYTQICGGSLVSNTVVISAAHCFWKDVGKKQPASNYAVAVGKLYQLWDDERDADAQKSDQNDCANGWDLTGLRCKKLEQSNVQPTSSRPLLDDKCVLPPYPDHGTYQMHNAPFAAPGQGFPLLQLTVNCKPGYRASGNSILFCQDGFWSGDMPTCVRLCKLDQHPSVQYRCLAPDDSAIIRDCNAYEPIGTIVRPECNTPNYYTSYLLPDMKCVDGGWNYVAICTPECGRVTPESVELMIGGRSAYRGELPWHAGIYSQKQGTYTQICGGSLVSNTVVISAAHCFWKDVGKKQPASNYAVAVGKLYQLWDDERDADAQKSDIKSIETPSRFRGRENNFQEDIAILILKTTIVYQTYVRPVCLNFDYNFDRRQLQHSKLGKVAGWGLTTENGNSSEILKVVELPYVDIDQCLKKLPLEFREHITSDKICAGYTNGTAPCRGDSGGGLSFAASDREVDRFFLRGIVSVAPTSDAFCNAYTYTAFTHLLRHEHFVKRHLWN